MKKVIGCLIFCFSIFVFTNITSYAEEKLLLENIKGGGYFDENDNFIEMNEVEAKERFLQGKIQREFFENYLDFNNNLQESFYDSSYIAKLDYKSIHITNYKQIKGGPVEITNAVENRGNNNMSTSVTMATSETHSLNVGFSLTMNIIDEVNTSLNLGYQVSDTASFSQTISVDVRPKTRLVIMFEPDMLYVEGNISYHSHIQAGRTEKFWGNLPILKSSGELKGTYYYSETNI